MVQAETSVTLWVVFVTIIVKYYLFILFAGWKQAFILYWLFSFNGKSKHFVYEMMYDTFCYEHGVRCNQW